MTTPAALLAHTICGRSDSADVIIFIHGICHRRHAWDALVPLMHSKYRIVTIDLPGHGESEPIPADVDAVDYTLDRVADTIAAVTGPEDRRHLVGNSVGGFIAIEMAARGFSHTVTALSPAGFSRGKWDTVKTVKLFQTMKILAAALNPILDPLAHMKIGKMLAYQFFVAHPQRISTEQILVDARAIVTNDTVSRALDRDIEFTPQPPDFSPLILWGTLDLVLPYYQASTVHSIFPNARLVALPGAGHVPMTDCPNELAAYITTQIRSVDQ